MLELVLGEPAPETVRVRGTVRRVDAPLSANLQRFGEGRDTCHTARLALADGTRRIEVDLSKPGWYMVRASACSSTCERRIGVERNAPEIVIEVVTSTLSGRIVDLDGNPIAQQSLALTRERRRPALGARGGALSQR